MARPPAKSEGAFRTIREVADWLGVPTHVLRFWESKFDMIAPVKGAGGRRYYRPEDMRLLGGIKVLLHDQGLTIRGVSQRIEADGIEPLMALSPDLDGAGAPSAESGRAILSERKEGTSRVVPFKARDEDDAPEHDAPADAPPTEIRKEGGGEPEDTSQPDAPDDPHPGDDPMPDQPVDTPAPPQPDDAPMREPRMPPQPVDDRPQGTPRVRVAVAPDRHVPEDEEGARDGLPAEPEDEVVQLGDATEADDDAETDPEAAPQPASPDTDAARLFAPGERRRLRRVVHRLRGMIDDVERELADGSGR